MVCGYDKCNAAMEFHHLDPIQKSYSISNGSSDWELLKIELDKCVLVCSNCHREFHDGMLDLYQYDFVSREDGEILIFEIEDYW